MNTVPGSGPTAGEPARLEALAETGLLDSLPEESFDRFTRIVRVVLRSEVSLLSLVDGTRQFFKSQSGLPAPYDRTRQTPLTHSFCRLVVESGKALKVEDARLDARVSQNLAIRDLGVISYLGMPVRTEDGYVLGSLCAINSRPREWSAEDSSLLEDLAAMVSAEIRLRQRTAALEEAVSLLEEGEEDRERGARMLVHDLRTPLAGVASSLELLGMTLPLPTAEQADLLQMADESCRKADSMVGELLAAPGREAQTRTTVAVSALIRIAAGMARPIVERHGLRLEVEAPSGGVLRDVEVRALERVLLNLVTNAVKFSPAGSEIVLAARGEVVGARRGYRFEVRDRGPGVPESEKRAIFGEARIGSAERLRGPESHGLGLAFCGAVVARHGGDIGVDDVPGGGSVFHFFLPE